jgi:uncharacterized OB-fold protein
MTQAKLPITVDTFYAEARKGTLIGLRCEFGHITVPTRPSCRVCRSLNLESMGLSGKGKVVSFTDVYVKSKEFPVETPYTLAIVKLDEGGNLLGVLRGDRRPVHGSKVVITFEDVGAGKWPRTFFNLE